MYSSQYRFLASYLLASLVFTPAAFGQIRSGTIVGTVTDPSGAPIPETNVTVIAQQTNVSFETATNESGQFTVPYLQFGPYTVTVAKAGFATAKVSDVAVTTAATSRVNVTLELSTVATTIEVSGAAVELQTESASVQGVTNEAIIQNVPNITNNPLYYATLQSGVVPRQAMNDTQGVYSMGIGIDGRRNFSAFSVNGGQAFTNDIQMDGVSVQGSAWNEAAVLPNPDGIQEVRTLINNFSAEYGRAQGVVQVTTKSGTNQFHGSGFWRLRNEALNANTFSNNSRGIPREPFKVNYYGGTFGGPIVRNRAFGFVSWEGLQHKRAADYLRTVPTMLERKGDFSQTLVRGQGGAPAELVIYDPFSAVPVAGQANVFQRDPYPNAVIPRPHPGVLNLLSYFPEPNRTPDDFTNLNNYFLRGIQSFDRNSLNSRFDLKVTDRWSLYWTGGFTKGGIETPPSWGEGNPFQSRNAFIGAVVQDDNPYAAVGNTFVLSPTMVADFRYGINRINTRNQAERFEGFDYSQFGIPALVQAINPVPGAATEFRPGGNWSPLNNMNSLHKWERQTNHHLVGSLTKTIGRWTLKFGSEYRVYLSNYIDAEGPGWIRSNAAFTREFVNATGGGVGVVTPEESGYEPASYLAGAGWVHLPPGRQINPALSQKYFALYTQNDWRATDRLTMNFGLRWDLQPGPTDRFDRLSGFDVAGSNPFGGPGGFSFAGAGAYPRNAYETSYKDFGPRFGLAYRLTDTLVLRAGYGITYIPTNTGYFDGPFTYGMDPFGPYTDDNNGGYGPNPNGVPIGTYSDVTRVILPTGPDANAPQLYGGGSFRFPFRDYNNGRTQQWNLFVEKRAANDWLFSAGYAASKGNHLGYARLPWSSMQFVPGDVLDQWRQDYIGRAGRGHAGTDLVTNPIQPGNSSPLPFQGPWQGARVQRWLTYQPFPLFSELQTQSSIGWSSYHSMQLGVKRSFSNGLQFDAHYTWSKALDFTQTEAQTNGHADTGGYTGGGMDLLNYAQNYKYSFTDIPHRFVISYLYELPFGRGRRFDPANPLISALVSGWRIGGVTIAQSGFPVRISGGSGNMNGRPDRVPGVPLELPGEFQRWYDGQTTVTLPSGRQVTPCNRCFLQYNPDAFRGRVIPLADGSYVNDVFWYGTSAYTFGDFRGAGMNNWNMSLGRTFRVTEGVSVDFLAQFTNVWNHTQFRPSMNANIGNTSLGNPSLGLEPGMGQNGDFGTRGDSTFDPRQAMFELKIRF